MSGEGENMKRDCKMTSRKCGPANYAKKKKERKKTEEKTEEKTSRKLLKLCRKKETETHTHTHTHFPGLVPEFSRRLSVAT